MSKRITSPVKRWPGSVTIADPITLPQAKLIENAMRPIESDTGDGRVFLSTVDEARLPAIFACVEKWELDNLPDDMTLETFPASPRGDSHKLAEWIFRELLAVYFGESVVPNE